MKMTIKHYALLLGVVLAFTQCQKEVFEPGSVDTLGELKDEHVNGDCVVVQDLWAGAGQNDTSKGTLVGSVTASISGHVLYVTYQVDLGWALTEAHLWVGSDPLKIPRNAAPGQFPFKKKLDNVTEVTFEIDLAELGIAPGEPVYIAAHGVVKGVEGVEVFVDMLPVEVSYKVTYFKNFGVPPLSYFQIEIKDGFLAGNHKGWCLDTSIPMTLNQFINNGKAYSSYGVLPADLFDKPENLPAVNWVVNNIFVGDASLGGFGKFTMGDLQLAFWVLLENEPNLNVPGGVGTYDMNRVAEIVERALENGANFIPVCGEKVAIIIVAPGQQITFIEFPVPCAGKADTVWAYGDYSFRSLGVANKWGWIFKLVCNED
jgi:hypothetical protein